MDWTQYALSAWTQPFLPWSLLNMGPGGHMSVGRCHHAPLRPNLMNTVVFLVETARSFMTLRNDVQDSAFDASPRLKQLRFSS